MPRIIPCLLLKDGGLVKGVKFKNHKYIGDPLNAVRIFNNKEVDELILLDISATIENRAPDLQFIERVADECYMPFTVGGGINNADQIREIIKAGAEKIVINTAAIEEPGLIKEASSLFGAQSIIVSIDVKKGLFNKRYVYSHCGNEKTKLEPVVWARKAERLGAGEILINSIDNDGLMQGYDLDLIKAVSGSVGIPVIALGGAGRIEHFKDGLVAGASAVAAGSMFVFNGKYKAVLINYPALGEVERIM
jgi:cyclase